MFESGRVIFATTYADAAEEEQCIKEAREYIDRNKFSMEDVKIVRRQAAAERQNPTILVIVKTAQDIK